MSSGIMNEMAEMQATAFVAPNQKIGKKQRKRKLNRFKDKGDVTDSAKETAVVDLETSAVVGEVEIAREDVSTADRVVVNEKKRRTFAGDLKIYLELWKEKERGSGWKFNKILQAWAVQNMLDEDKIDSALFKLLIPYVLTIKGGALTRLTESLLTIINSDNVNRVEELTASSIDTKEVESSAASRQSVSKSAMKRAVKLYKKINDTQA